LGDVFWFFQAFRVSLPGLGKLPAEQVDHIQSKMGSRISVGAGGGMMDPSQCGLLGLIPLAF
jgi:hypothetical protein